MTWRIAWMAFGAAAAISTATTISPDSAFARITITMLIIGGVLLLILLVREIEEPRVSKHRHTFGTWETAWWKNENGTKAGVASQIRTCTECGLIEKRKP